MWANWGIKVHISKENKLHISKKCTTSSENTKNCIPQRGSDPKTGCGPQLEGIAVLTRVEVLTITKSKGNKLEWLRLFHQVFVGLTNVGKGFSMAVVIYTNRLVTLFIFSTLITSIPFLEFSPTSPRGNPFRPPRFALFRPSNWN